MTNSKWNLPHLCEITIGFNKRLIMTGKKHQQFSSTVCMWNWLYVMHNSRVTRLSNMNLIQQLRAYQALLVALPANMPQHLSLLFYHYYYYYVLSTSQSEQEAQLSQRDRVAACLNDGKNISAKSVHLGYFF